MQLYKLHTLYALTLRYWEWHCGTVGLRSHCRFEDPILRKQVPVLATPNPTSHRRSEIAEDGPSIWANVLHIQQTMIGYLVPNTAQIQLL